MQFFIILILELAIAAQLRNTVAAPREYVILACYVNQQDVSSTWLKDGEPLSESDRHEVKVDGLKHYLVISKCQWTDAGSYTAMVKDTEVVSSCTLGEFLSIWCEVLTFFQSNNSNPLVNALGK